MSTPQFWSAENIAAVTAGRWLTVPPRPAQTIPGLSIDTRTLRVGQAFLALRGDKHDAHDFLADAARAGAGLLIVDQEDKTQSYLASRPANLAPPVLAVRDALAALQQLATVYRDHLGAAGVRVIAIGGSNGKTTTRHLLHTVLSATLAGSQSPKSFNNHIGVPLTLLAADPAHQFVVVEIGTNHPGEIDRLGRIVRPDAAVIVSIGREHLEFFRDLQGVAREEAAIVPCLRRPALLVTPAQAEQRHALDPLLPRQEPGVTQVTFALDASDATLSAPRRQTDAAGWRFTDSTGQSFQLPLLGEHNVANALAVLAVARWMGLNDDQIRAGMASATPVPGRLEQRRLGPPDKPLLLIHDAYNANPDSVRAAVGMLLRLAPPTPGGRRVVVLGDMFELGPAGPDEHRGIGRLLLDLCGDPALAPACAGLHVVLIGRLSMFIAETLARAWPGQRLHPMGLWDEAVPTRVAALLQPGDAVLLKASRGMALERLIPALEQRAAAW